MLKRARRVLRQLSPHEHRWVRQHLGGGLERSVCDRCGGFEIFGSARPSVQQETTARQLWHLS